MADGEKNRSRLLSDTRLCTQQLPQAGTSGGLPKVISEEFLTCKICFESFCNPKILTCLHSFCLQCLRRHVANNNLGVELPCPLCRQTTDISGGVEALRDNFFIASLQEAVANEDGQSHAQVRSSLRLCDSCNSCRQENKEADMQCVECSEFLCNECIRAHQRLSLTKDHQLVKVTTDQAKPQASCQHEAAQHVKTRKIFCSRHPEEICRMYCELCQKVMCLKCKLTTHEGHPCCGLEQAASQEKENLAKSLVFVKSRIEAYTHILDDWRTYKNDLLRQKQSLQTKLDKRRKELHSLIDGWHYAMSQQLDTTYREEDKHVGAKIELVEVQLDTNMGICQLAEDILDSARQLRLLNLKDQLATDLGRLQRENVNSMCLTQKSIMAFNVGNQTLNFDQFGSFVFSQEKVFSSARVHHVQFITFTSQFMSRPAMSGSRYDASAITADNIGNMIVTDRQMDRIVVYTVRGETVKEVSTAAIGKPISSAATHQGDIVCTRSKPSLCVFSNTGQRAHVLKDSLSKPCCVTVSHDNHIYILDYDLKMVSKFCGLMYAKVFHVTLNYEKGSVWDKIAVNSHDNIYLCAHSENRIYEFTSTGQRLSVYGHLGSTAPGDLYWPRGMCVDNQDNIIVADTHNNRLQLLSPQGTWTVLQTTDDHRLKSPTDVTVTPKGTLAVLEKNGNVLVFDYLPY